MRRELTHFWRTNLAVTLGAAVATAVLGGALVVGDSVRGSLRQLTLERLGGVDHALAGQRFFPTEAVDRLAALPGFGDEFRSAAPAILLQASVRHAETRTRATQVGLQGIDERFLAVFGQGDGDGDGDSGDASTISAETFFAPESAQADAGGSARPRLSPPAVINTGLSQALGAAVGDTIVVSLRRWSEVPSGSLLARDDTESVVGRLRLEVSRILPDRNLGQFGLAVHQGSPYNIFVPMSALQANLDQEGTVNAILVSEGGVESADRPIDAEAARLRSGRLDALLRSALEPADLGLLVSPGPAADLRDSATADDTDATRAGRAYFTVESSEFILEPPVFEAIEQTARERGTETLPVLTYLANGLRLVDEGSEPGVRASAATDRVPYSTVAALPVPPPFGKLTLVDGSPAPALGPDQLLLGEWAADELGARVGDRLRLEYFTVGAREELREEEHDFEIVGIVALDGLGADEGLSQEYPGIAGSENMAEWDPPFPVDLGEIRAADEEYWDLYRDTPKAFVALETGRRLWQNRWGDITSVRVLAPGPGSAPAPGSEPGVDPEAEIGAAREFATAVKDRLPMATFGLTFQPVKALGLGASGGATDFGGLFVGLSQFVIVSAALLVALLFGLAVERRASEIGLRLAVGYRPGQVRRMLLGEGLVLAALGGLVGLLGAVAYAQLMMWGLRTWWLPAVGTSRLDLYISPTALLGGYFIALAVVGLTIFLTVRRVGRTPTPQLLRGAVAGAEGGKRAGRISKLLAAICLGVAFAVLAWGGATGQLDQAWIFYVVGPLLLVGLLAFFAVWIDRPQAGALERPGLGSRLRMAVVNSRRNRGRSVLSTTLVAFATFLIVTVAAYREDFSADELGLDSGAGGYQLVAEADVPLQQNLADPDGRFELGLPDSAEAQLAGASIMPFRLLPGDDTSCLNLYQPGQPRVLGVPDAQIERGGFRFQQTLEERENPWELLDMDLGEGVIPAIGDFNSTQWILKLPLGEDLVLENERGEAIRLRLVASLATSVFQSELLISEDRFLEHFPSRGGYPYFLLGLGESAGDGSSGDGAAGGGTAGSTAGNTAGNTAGLAGATPDERRAALDSLSQTLEAGLEPYGFDAVTTADKLAAFHAVQNTYLSTFRSLGGLGLLLGTIGLAVVLLRNVLERRGELAALRAFGFRRRTLVGLVVLENATLLLVGLGVGTLAALATAGSHVLHGPSAVPWASLAATLGGIFSFGLLACWFAARGALSGELLSSLKEER